MECFLVMLFGLSLTHGLTLNDHSVKYDGDSEVWEGDSFEISCILPLDDPGQWTINSSEVIRDENDKGYILRSRKVDSFLKEMLLEVGSAQLYQEGEYRCNMYSRDYHYVKIRPSFPEGPGEEGHKESHPKPSYEYEYMLKINQTFEFFCASAKDDDTVVTWYKNGGQITDGSKPNLLILGRDLLIENAEEKDAGEYMCTVSLQETPGLPDFGRIFRLKSPAKIIGISEKVNVARGHRLILYCKAQGFPPPKINWLVGNLNASQSNRTNGRLSTWLVPSAYGEMTTLFLKVENASNADRGLYTCRAENSVDSGATLEHDEESVFAHIRENMLLPNEDEPGRGKILTPGDMLLLHCNTTECQNCTVIWFKDGNRLYNTSELKVYERNNSVVISNPTYNDSGIYMCAINKEQLEVDLNATIVVQSKIKLEKFEPSSVVVQGSPLELLCNAKGGPTPHVRWFIGEEEIDDDDERIQMLDYDGLKNGKLYIEEADFSDRNHYTCEAYNQVDSVNTTIFVRIKDKLAALWPFLGICAEVAILCTIIFVYERRKSMTQCDEPDTDLPTENKHHRDQKAKGPDVRQRK